MEVERARIVRGEALPERQRRHARRPRPLQRRPRESQAVVLLVPGGVDAEVVALADVDGRRDDHQQTVDARAAEQRLEPLEDPRHETHLVPRGLRPGEERDVGVIMVDVDVPDQGVSLQDVARVLLAGILQPPADDLFVRRPGFLVAVVVRAVSPPPGQPLPVGLARQADEGEIAADAETPFERGREGDRALLQGAVLG